MKQTILSYLPGDHPWQNTICYFDTLPSTNDYAKELASQGAPEGTVILAGNQTAGRGRLGRSFHAPAGMGVYLSLILRPDCTPDQLMHLTCAVASAMCDAVEDCAKIRPKIKWINDLVCNNKKLGGILTELSVNNKTGLTDWAVIGIGINCLHKDSDFPPEIRDIATSLLQATGKKTEPSALAAAMIRQLYKMRQVFLTEKKQIMEAYKKDCLTIGKEVMLLRGDEKRPATAIDLDDDGGMLVRFPDGSTQTVQSGEISVRGLYGYL